MATPSQISSKYAASPPPWTAYRQDCTRKHLEAMSYHARTYPISFLGYKEMLVLPTNGLKTYSLPLSSRSRILTSLLWTELAFELTAAAAFAFWIVSLHSCTSCKLFTSPLYNSDSKYLTQNASNAQNEQRKHAYNYKTLNTCEGEWWRTWMVLRWWNPTSDVRMVLCFALQLCAEWQGQARHNCNVWSL